MGIFGRDEETNDQRSAQPVAKTATSSSQKTTAERTIIARPSVIEGHVSGSGEIVVNGLVKGTIDASGTVRIAELGRVEATIHGRVVGVAGAVAGDITADDKIELEATAKVDGNITAPRILINDGATFKGQVNMKDPEKRPQVRTSSARKDPGDLFST